MTAPTKINFKVYQGSTFSEVLRWESSTKVYKTISGITRTAPMVVTATTHGVAAGWRTKITNVAGMIDINSDSRYLTVTLSDTNTLTYNDINAVGFKDYISGGILEYNDPVSLSGITARMDIREKLSSTTTIKTLTSGTAGGITINDSLKTITITISATDTAAFTFKSAVYSMELVNGTVVTPFIYGNIILENEITR